MKPGPKHSSHFQAIDPVDHFTLIAIGVTQLGENLLVEQAGGHIETAGQSRVPPIGLYTVLSLRFRAYSTSDLRKSYAN
jgi:hypothetical protein